MKFIDPTDDDTDDDLIDAIAYQFAANDLSNTNGEPKTFEGSMSFGVEPGDTIPMMTCPECEDACLEIGSTIDEKTTAECPGCDWFKLLD